MIRHYIIPIFVPHVGCPHDCIFCNQKKITGNNEIIDYKYVIERAEEYLKTMQRERSIIEISFYGGSFTGIPMNYQNELLSAANKLLKEGKIHSIRLSTRPDYINEFILDNLKKHNVRTIELGVQSLDDDVLVAAERGHTSYDVYNAVSLIKKYGFKLGLQMMIGLPKDSEEKDIQTARKIVDLKPDFVRIYPAVVIKDTEMEHMYRKGKYIPLTIDEAIHITKKVYLIFIKNDIKIIRIGLQASEGIALGKDVVAGPFHPAFRELVESAIMCDMIEYILKQNFEQQKDILIKVNGKSISKLYSNKKFYFSNMLKKLKNKKLVVKIDNTLNDLEVVVEGDLSRKMSIKDYANIVV